MHGTRPAELGDRGPPARAGRGAAPRSREGNVWMWPACGVQTASRRVPELVRRRALTHADESCRRLAVVRREKRSRQEHWTATARAPGRRARPEDRLLRAVARPGLASALEPNAPPLRVASRHLCPPRPTVPQHSSRRSPPDSNLTAPFPSRHPLGSSRPQGHSPSPSHGRPGTLATAAPAPPPTHPTPATPASQLSTPAGRGPAPGLCTHCSSGGLALCAHPRGACPALPDSSACPRSDFSVGPPPSAYSRTRAPHPSALRVPSASPATPQHCRLTSNQIYLRAL